MQKIKKEHESFLSDASLCNKGKNSGSVPASMIALFKASITQILHQRTSPNTFNPLADPPRCLHLELPQNQSCPTDVLQFPFLTPNLCLSKKPRELPLAGATQGLSLPLRLVSYLSQVPHLCPARHQKTESLSSETISG